MPGPAPASPPTESAPEKATRTVFGMPWEANALGAVDAVASLPRIARLALDLVT